MVDSIGVSLLLPEPCIVAILWTWSRAPRSEAVPPSMADARESTLGVGVPPGGAARFATTSSSVDLGAGWWNDGH